MHWLVGAPLGLVLGWAWVLYRNRRNDFVALHHVATSHPYLGPAQLGELGVRYPDLTAERLEKRGLVQRRAHLYLQLTRAGAHLHARKCKACLESPGVNVTR